MFAAILSPCSIESCWLSWYPQRKRYHQAKPPNRIRLGVSLQFMCLVLYPLIGTRLLTNIFLSSLGRCPLGRVTIKIHYAYCEGLFLADECPLWERPLYYIVTSIISTYHINIMCTNNYFCFTLNLKAIYSSFKDQSTKMWINSLCTSEIFHTTLIYVHKDPSIHSDYLSV